MVVTTMLVKGVTICASSAAALASEMSPVLCVRRKREGAHEAANVLMRLPRPYTLMLHAAHETAETLHPHATRSCMLPCTPCLHAHNAVCSKSGLANGWHRADMRSYMTHDS